ncbi:GTP cyclohydrolase I [bacterium]|nr:MAG: GTP cyclohydrolase I [bacterium]
MTSPTDGAGRQLERLHDTAEEDEAPAWERLRHREISPEQWQRFEGYMAEVLHALGLDLKTPGTERTPTRFLRALFDATEGFEGDPKLVTAFPTECRGEPDCRISQVVEGPIPFFSLCEHHSLPFFGHAYVGYIAHERIIGISKLTRLVRLFGRRFTVQERIGHQIVEALDEILQAHGVAVYLEAVHLCTQMRGVRERESSTRTSFWRGAYDTDPELRAGFFRMCGLGGS